MSTHCAIGIKQDDGNVTGVYCHFDGYLDHVGRILKEYYNTQEKVEELLSYGDILSLYKDIHPNPYETHDFDNRQEDVCIFFFRDKGAEKGNWEDNAPRECEDEDEFIKRFTWMSYYYLFDNGKWYWTRGSYEWTEL